MGGSSSKQTNGKTKLEILEDNVNEIVNDILNTDGTGKYKFSDNKLHNYRNLTDSIKCKQYVAFVEKTMKDTFDTFPIYDKDKKLGDVTLIELTGDHKRKRY